MSIIELKPSVPKLWLFALAGIMWTAVGVMLLWRAVGWFMDTETGVTIALALLAVVLAYLVYRFMFTNTVRKNIRRLCLLPEGACLFAFNSWKGYILIALMITMGVTLRHSAIPRVYLAVVYATMGGALFLASFHFYAHLWRMSYKKEPCLADVEPPSAV